MTIFVKYVMILIINYFSAAKEARSCIKELTDHVGDELTWRAYQDFCSVDIDNCEDARQSVLESRYHSSILKQDE